MSLYRDPTARLREMAGMGYGPAPAVSREEIELAKRQAQANSMSESAKAFEQGVTQVKSSALSARGLLRIGAAQVGLGREEGGVNDLRRAQAMNEDAAAYGPRVQSLQDVKGAGDAVEWARNAVLTQLPVMGSMLVGGVAGGVVRQGLSRGLGEATQKALAREMAGRVAGGKAARKGLDTADVSKELQDKALRRVQRLTPAPDATTLAKQFAQGSTVGAGVGSVGLQAGIAPDIVLDEEGTGTVAERAGKAALGALATGALETLPVMALLRRYGLTGAQSAVTGGVMARMAKQGARQAGQEGVTELAQTVGEKLTHKWVNENVELMGPEAYADYLNSMAAGALVGGVFGAPAGIRGAGKDSEAGKRFREGLRDYTERLRRPLDGGSGGAAAGTETGAAFDLNDIKSRVSDAAETVGVKAKGVVDSVTKTFNEQLSKLGGEAAADHSIDEILETKGFQAKPVGDDGLMLNEGGGVSQFKDLIVNPKRAELLTSVGVNQHSAILLSMIEDSNVARELLREESRGLSQEDLTGKSWSEQLDALRSARGSVINEVTRMLLGEDPEKLDDKMITRFQDLLPPDKRAHFNAMMMTARKLREDADRLQLAPEKADAVAIETLGEDAETGEVVEGGIEGPLGIDYQSGQAMETRDDRGKGEQYVAEPLYNHAEAVARWKQKEGKPIPRGTPKQTVILVGEDGVRRGLSGRSIGREIVEMREAMPEMRSAPVVTQLAQVLANYATQGYQIEPESLRPMTLGKGWEITQEHIDALVNAETSGVRRQGPPTPGLGGAAPAAQDTKGLAQDYGAREFVETHRDENKREGEVSRAPVRAGSPQGLRVSSERETDTRARRVGAAQIATDNARRALDEILLKYTDRKAIKSEAERTEAFDEVAALPQPKIVAALVAADSRLAIARDAEAEALQPKKTDVRVVAEKGRVSEAQTIDSGEVDRKALKAEREAAREPELDDLLAKHTGARPDPRNSNDRNKRLFAARAKLARIAKRQDPEAAAALVRKGTPANRVVAEAAALARQELRALNEAADAFVERDTAQAVAGLNKARKAYAAAWEKVTPQQRHDIGQALNIKDAVNPKSVKWKVDNAESQEARDGMLGHVSLAPIASALDKLRKAEYRYEMSGLKAQADVNENARRARPELAAPPPPKPPKTGTSDVRAGKFAPVAKTAVKAEAADTADNSPDDLAGPRAKKQLDAALRAEGLDQIGDDAPTMLHAMLVMVNKSLPKEVRALARALYERVADALAAQRAKLEPNPKLRQRILDERAANKAAGPEFDSRYHDLSSDNSADGIDAEIKHYSGVRSKSALYALLTKIATSDLPGATKAEFLKKVNAQLVALREEIKVAGSIDRSINVHRTLTAEQYAARRDALAKATTVEDALRAVREHANPGQAKLIKFLLASGALKGVTLEVSTEIGVNGVVLGSHQNTRVWGSGESRRVLDSHVVLTMSAEGMADGKSSDAIVVLLHEAVHATTSYMEFTNPKLRRDMQKLLAHARREAAKAGIDVRSYYGLAETQEFIAEAFTNPRFQHLLQGLSAANTESYQSLWDQFKDFVRDLMGVPRGSEAATALDEAFALGVEMSRLTAVERDAVYNEVLSAEPDNSAGAGNGNGGGGNLGSVMINPNSGGAPTDYMALLSPHERLVLNAAFRRPEVLRQIEAAVPADRRAELRSADKGPYLLVNTGIVLALQGRLDMTYDAHSFKGVIQGLWELLSQALQMPSKTAYARQALAQLARGVAPAAVNSQAALLGPTALKVTRYIQANIKPVYETLMRDIDRKMRGAGIPALVEMATIISQRTGEFRADGAASYNEAKLSALNKHLETYFRVTEGWTDARKAAALSELQRKVDNPSADTVALRQFYTEMGQYLRDAGLKFNKVTDFFPVAMDPEKVLTNRAELVALLTEFGEHIRRKEIAHLREQIAAIEPTTARERNRIRRLKSQINATKRMTDAELAEKAYEVSAERVGGATHVGGVSFAEGDHDPAFRPLNTRMMDYIYDHGTPEQIARFAEFQDTNLDRVSVHYVNRGVRRAEWERLGIGPRLKELLAKAEQQGATPRDLAMAKDYVNMQMGSYGTQWHPLIQRVADAFGVTLPAFEKMQRLNNALVAYQNIRLLPLALMSSFIDPLGVAVRDGGSTRLFGAYRDAVRAFRDANGTTALGALARDMGLVQRMASMEILTQVYGGLSDPTGRSAKVNAMLFKLNGLEYMTRFSRLAALAAGSRFLLHHKHNPSQHSARYLEELGLNPGDINAGADGYVTLNPKVEAALNRFVNESVIRLTPGQRPGWQNDPHFRLAAQYKGYLYGFYNTVVRRIGHEVGQGNYAVITPALMYIPVQMMGEMLRDAMQDDGEDKEPMDYLSIGIDRSGLLGPVIGQLQDTTKSAQYGNLLAGTLAGPSGQQATKLYDSLIGQGDLHATARDALPASALHKKW